MSDSFNIPIDQATTIKKERIANENANIPIILLIIIVIFLIWTLFDSNHGIYESDRVFTHQFSIEKI